MIQNAEKKMLEFLDTDQLYTAEISLAWMSDEPFSELNPYFFIAVKSPCILEVKFSFSSHPWVYHCLFLWADFSLPFATWQYLSLRHL